MVDIEVIAKDIVDCAIKVHKALGPGLLESAYQHCHTYELCKRGWDVKTEVKLPILFDTLVNGLVIIENKSVESLLPIHEAQLLTYMKLSGCKMGFLLNWNVTLMKHGIRRYVLGLDETNYHKRPSLLLKP